MVYSVSAERLSASTYSKVQGMLTAKTLRDEPLLFEVAKSGQVGIFRAMVAFLTEHFAGEQVRNMLPAIRSMIGAGWR